RGKSQEMRRMSAIGPPSLLGTPPMTNGKTGGPKSDKFNRPACRHFAKKGHCRYEDPCAFYHPELPKQEGVSGRCALVKMKLETLVEMQMSENDEVSYLQAITLRRVFGNCLPPFPPKYYLAMTASMADERRDQLEQYLQNGAMLRHQGYSEVCSGLVRLAIQRSWPIAGFLKSVVHNRTELSQRERVTMDPNMLRSDVFVDFLKLVQLDTFSITTKKASLDIFLPDGRSIKVEILTSDTAERVLEVVSRKIGLCQELLGYFGLFLIRSYKEGKLSVIKKLVDFELPYVSLCSSEVENFQVGLRKWYLDPSLDSRLMDCRAAVDLIYMQAIQDIEKEWAKPTEVQRQKLEALQKEDNQTKQFLELSQEVWHYGYVQLDRCTCDYPEPGCGTVLSVGNNEISCCITLPGNQTQDVIFQMNRVKCWQVTFLVSILAACLTHDLKPPPMILKS
ncbi:hypothetical protein E2I00_004031, partial [Balaenoptera physalus]